MRRVNPKVYTEEYYLTDCTGYDEFKKTHGSEYDVSFKELIKYFKIQDGMKVLDVGCGRGEMALYCASKGADAIGIDYSDAAIKLANLARNKQSKYIQSKAKFIKMDAKKLKFYPSSFDMVILSGVVEHLYPEELDIVFKEIKRVLKPNGKAVISTAPNRLFNDIIYKLYCYPVSSLIVFLWNTLTNSKYPNIAHYKKIRTASHKIMHINEPTFFSLMRLYKKFNFTGELLSSNITVRKQHLSIKDVIFNLIVFLHPFSKKFPLNVLFGSDFISVLRNNK